MNRFELTLSDGAHVYVDASSATAARINYERDHQGGARVVNTNNFGPIARRHAGLRFRRVSHEQLTIDAGGEE